ncbi:MAG TPA: spore germination protein [Cerasibacillus sp.]|uniref:spore germination protein n=1 Tax=Cerasibacillus sp. TaxID=2498711 RepID=UPI002F4038B9
MVMKRIYENVQDVEKYMKKRIGLGTSFDVGVKHFVVMNKKAQLYFVNGLIDSMIISRLLEELVEFNNRDHMLKRDVLATIENRLIHEQVSRVKTMDEAVDQILTGLIAIFIEGQKSAFIIDVRSYPGRSPEEPDTERVIRGSRDGYTENIIENTGLTRRRIKDERLRNEMLVVGERSKTDVCVSYIKDIADETFVDVVKHKISEIDVDGIPMADKSLEEFILGGKWSPFPMVRYTERPDVAARHLMDGHVIVHVDTSPTVIILPTTYFNCLEHAEEYRQAPAAGTFIRWVRLFAVLASIFLLPLWLLFVMEPSLLPPELSFIGPKEEGNVPIVFQIILADVGVEFLRMAAVHTPTPLATAMGLIAAVLIGQIAVDVGLLSSEVILYVAISTIGSYVTPSYELSIANKIAKLFLIITTALFGVSGFMIGTLVTLIYLVRLKAFKTPYMWPFIPFDLRGMWHFIMRIPVPFLNIRPEIVHPKDQFSQPQKK